jgi:curved DNA-binding protein CbpA
MLSTVKSRANHYETLGLTPSATAEEIGRAFETRMSLLRARPLDSATQVCIAYETLRDPAKRRDYDRSLGLTKEPDRRPWAIAAQQRWAPFSASVTARPASVAPARPPEPHVTTVPELEEDIDARVASIAASLRELAKPLAVEERPAPAPEPIAQKPREPRPQVPLEQLLEEIRTAPVVREERSFDWRRPALAAGGLLAGAAFIGGVAGLSVTHNEETAQAQPGVTVALPEAKLQATGAAAAPAPVEGSIERPAQWHVRAPARVALHRKTLEEQRAASGDQGSAPPDELASDPLAPQPAVQPLAAKLPLPGSVVARTIERIGYSCGEVVASEAGGAPGVFKVTCSSGQSYQATPVHGRYRFRRLE